jgi:hypothetical protein
VLRLRMFAVKNSMKRSLVSAPAAVIAAGSDSMPTRMSAGGAATTSPAVKIMSSLGISDTRSMVSSPSPFVYHKGRYDGLTGVTRQWVNAFMQLCLCVNDDHILVRHDGVGGFVQHDRRNWKARRSPERVAIVS